MPTDPTTYGPYSPAVVVGDTVYISGQTPVNAETGNAPVSISDQVTQALENLKAVLGSVQASMDNVVKTTIYLTDMSDFAEMNEAYVKYFKQPRPARTTVAVKELPRIGDTPLKIEIDAIAVKA